MSRPLFVRPEADQDLEEILAFLAAKRARSMRKFETNYRRILSLISHTPFLFAKVWRNVRRVKVRGFKYVVCYIVTKHYIEIFAITHGARDTSSWRSRL